MLFSSIPFLYWFLPLALIAYFSVPFRWKNSILLVFSLVFYGWGEPVYLLLMAATILLFYFSGIAIKKTGKRLYLILSVVLSLALLGLFKYADFLISGVNSLLGTQLPFLRLALPIGISFYTFQCLSYTVDVWRGNAKAQKNLVRFAAYVTLFPQLIAGPIVRYVDVERELSCRSHSREAFYLGIRRFLFGLSKKVLIANVLGELTNRLLESGEKTVLGSWLYAVAFALHIYFDFSGYSDMAIGLGRIFGFHFPENFTYPYISTSIAEFWRRWHRSLGSWFRDYVYIPLGGNRVKTSRWVFNIFVVWLLTGLWHGAAWNFVLWGLLYGIFLLLERAFPTLQKLPKPLGHIYVLFIVMVGFVLFHAESVTQGFRQIGGLFGIGSRGLFGVESLYCLQSYGLLLLIAAIGATPLPKRWAERYSQTSLGKALEALSLPLLLLLCTAYLVDGSFNPFLYFRF